MTGLVEYRAACKDCRAGLGEWSDHNATASLQAREHALGTSHDTVVQTRRRIGTQPGTGKVGRALKAARKNSVVTMDEIGRDSGRDGKREHMNKIWETDRKSSRPQDNGR